MQMPTFFLRLAGRDGDESLGRSEASSLRVESRRGRCERFDGLGMMTRFDSLGWGRMDDQGHAAHSIGG